MTPKAWRLTRQAEASLIDIAEWTIETFGARQADAYEAELIACCNGIAAGTAPVRSCRRLIDPALDDTLNFVRCGMHLVIFVERDETMIIVDFLHGRSDLPRRIAELPLDD